MIKSQEFWPQEFWHKEFWPLEFWKSAFRAPLSGNVSQSIDPRIFSPTVNLDFAGDAEMEGRIVSEVASYGEQLDQLIGAVLKLAEHQDVDLKDLRELSNRIEATKETHKGQLKERAEAALTALREADPEAYDTVINRR